MSHHFSYFLIEEKLIVGACTKCGLKREELLDQNNEIKICEFPDSEPPSQALINLEQIVMQFEALVVGQESLKNDVKKLKEDIFQLKPKPTTTLTPTTLATQSLQSLTDIRDYVFEAKPNKSAILSTEEYLEAHQKSPEHQLVNFLTPFLRPICEPALVFVNSEEFPWMETGNVGNNQKPDCFYSPIWAIRKKISTTKVHSMKGFDEHPEWYFGEIADFRLRDSLRIVDCKINMSLSGYGEHLIHLQQMKSPNTDRPSIVRGMYCGADGFWLSESVNNLLVYRIQAKWTDGGTVELLNKFFCTNISDDWPDIGQFCNYFNCRILDPFSLKATEDSTNIPNTAFLGAGTFGRVLRVFSNSNDELHAMKVCRIQHVALIEAEHAILTRHNRECGCDLLVKPMSEFVYRLDLKLCGYLMQPVGERCLNRNDVNRKTIKLILDSMFCLHKHDIVHGDPRLPNLIMRSEDKYFWIDILDYSSIDKLSPTIMCNNILKDIEILVSSMFSKEVIEIVEIKNALYNYSQTPTQSSIDALCTVLTYQIP